MASREEAGAGTRGYVKFTAGVARAICERVAAGEHLTAICADPDMPSVASVTRWARKLPKFAKIYHRAKAFAARTDGLGPTTTYCEVIAHEICVRVSEGETLASISSDPAMPALWTIMHWQRKSAGFAAALALAKEARAERMADIGWEMALEATPETAFLTHVRLGHLRWRVAIAAPKTHGRHKASDPPAPPPEPEERVILFKHFRIEENKETGQIRTVTYVADPETRQPVRDSEGAWTAPFDPEGKARDIHRAFMAEAERRRLAGLGRLAPAPDGAG